MADEVLSVYGVVTHVELHDLRNRLFITQLHLVKSHTFSDEIFELIRRNLSKTFESRDFNACFQSAYSLVLLFDVVAVSYLLLVLDPEEGSLEDVYMATSDEVWVVFHEESKHKHTDVHSVIIGIRSHNDLLVAEVLDVVLQSECVDQEIELLVLGNLLAAFLVAVDRLSSEREYSLGFCVTCLCDGSAR